MALNKSGIDYLKHAAALINRPGYTLNIVTGCKHGCEYCYARRMVEHGRLKGHASYPHGFLPTYHPERIRAIGGKPKLIFLNDMADVGGDWNWFHKVQLLSDVPTICSPELLAKAMVRFATLNPQHILLLLTKNPSWYRLAEWPDNVWCGFSATNNEELKTRAGQMPKNMDAGKMWISAEPWLDEEPPHIARNVTCHIWTVIGGMSGPKAQPVSGPTRDWLKDNSVKARRFTKMNALTPLGQTVGNYPREYPEAWKVTNAT